MQDDFAERYPSLDVQLIAVNEIGHSSGIETAVDGRSLPFLQDDSTQRVWENWAVTYRDVIVLDGENKVAGILNLTGNSLAEAEHYSALEGILLDAAGMAGAD